MNNNHTRMLVANWKMYLTFSQADSFITQYGHELNSLSTQAGIEISIFPSFEALNALAISLQNTSLKFGAQNCSAHSTGAFTGQVAASSLKDIGCSYVLIGHSEMRNDFQLSNATLLAQIERTLEQDMTPIFCIGETSEEYKQKTTIKKLTAQLEPLIAAVKKTTSPIIIAYEPMWSIGTGLTAEPAYLGSIVQWIHEYSATHCPSNMLKVLYGGSVDGKSAKDFWGIKGIAGLLVGKASTDFQLLKKIVLSVI